MDRQLTPQTQSELIARVDQYRSSFSNVRETQRMLDAFRHLDTVMMEYYIYGDVTPEETRPVIPENDINAVTTTAVSLLATTEPKHTVIPRNRLQVRELQNANLGERISRSLFSLLNEHRATSLTNESTEHAIAMGIVCGKWLWRTPEERGEKYGKKVVSRERERGFTTILSNGDMQAGSLMPQDSYEEVLEEEGEFPLELHLLDPRQCYYTNGANGETIEFVHEFRTSWAILCTYYPELHSHPSLSGKIDYKSQKSVRVIDYWNQTHNAILIEGEWFKEPKEHKYPDGCPIVVQTMNHRKIVDMDAEGGSPNFNYSEEPTPFCYAMVQQVRWAAWANSISAAHIGDIGHAVLIHEGIDINGNSPYITWDPKSNRYRYEAVIDMSPDNRVLPAFGREGFRYLEPPPLVPILEKFSYDRKRNAAIVSFNDAILTGQASVEFSGYAFALQRQAAMARLQSFLLGLNRFWGRMMTKGIRILAHFYDRDEGYPYLLSDVVAEGEEIELTRELLDGINRVKVEFIPDIPIDREKEVVDILQQVDRGVMSRLAAIDKLGEVEDAQNELERIIFEQTLMESPDLRYEMALEYMRKNQLGRFNPANGMQQEQGGDPAALQAGAAPAGVDPAAMAAMAGGGMPMPAGAGGGMDPAAMAAMAQGGGGMPMPQGASPETMNPEALLQMIMQAQQQGAI